MKTWSALFYLAALIAGVCRGDALPEQGYDYRYETRPTRGQPNGERHRHVAALLGRDTVGLFGGFSVGETELYDVASETFTQLPEKRYFGDHSGVALANGRALLVQGPLDCEFDPATRKFAYLAGTFTGKFARWAVLLPLPDGRVFACGGYDTDFKPLADCAIYDPSTRAFAPVGRLVLPRAWHTASLLDDRRILVAGGAGADYTKTAYDGLEIFDLKTGTSATLPVTLRQARSRHGAAALPDGRILLVGGSDPQHKAVDMAEIFDPKTGTLSNGGTLLLVRSDLQVARLPSGRIAVFGGGSGVRVTEIYCPDERRFILADALMIAPRDSGFTVTPLPGGEFLIVGGRPNSSSEVLRAAEIFTEKRVAARPRTGGGAGEWAARLGDEQGRVRDEAVRRLVALGPAAEAAVRPLLTSSDPEISFRAGEVLKGLAARAEAKWCVEIWDAGGKRDTLWFADYTLFYRDDDKGPLTELGRGLKTMKEPRLVVRCPDGVAPEKQARVLNAVGGLRTPLVTLGEPLPEKTATEARGHGEDPKEATAENAEIAKGGRPAAEWNSGEERERGGNASSSRSLPSLAAIPSGGLR